MNLLFTGARAIAPLAIAVFPFGLVFGVTLAESSFSGLAGIASSLLVFAGAAQLALVNLVDDHTPWTIVVLTALVINARLLMYSGALAPAFGTLPRRWRFSLAHLITDQTTVTWLRFSEIEPDGMRRRDFFLVTGLLFLVAWCSGTVLGYVVGATIPAELQLGFAVPLMFIALVVPTVRDRPSCVAAAVGFAVTLLARDAPLNTGLLIGAAAGIAFGMVAKR